MECPQPHVCTWHCTSAIHELGAHSAPGAPKSPQPHVCTWYYASHIHGLGAYSAPDVNSKNNNTQASGAGVI